MDTEVSAGMTNRGPIIINQTMMPLEYTFYVLVATAVIIGILWATDRKVNFWYGLMYKTLFFLMAVPAFLVGLVYAEYYWL